METSTRPIKAKAKVQTAVEEPNLSTALWAIAGFIVFAAVIFALVVYRTF